MIAQGAGSIVNVASICGERGGFGAHDYSVGKSALLHLTRCAAVELGEYGVRVNSVSPGPIATGIFEKAVTGVDEEPAGDPVPFVPLLPSVQPLPRVGSVDDVAAVVAFLAGPDAVLINGETLTADGGIMAGWPWSVTRSQWATMIGS